MVCYFLRDSFSEFFLLNVRCEMKNKGYSGLLLKILLVMVLGCQGQEESKKNKAVVKNEHVEEGKKMHKYTNLLIHEKSPYLLQHAHNPVNWYPWGAEAFEKAKKENKLIFLSIGYSTCHWCHVMEKESFEKEDVAALLNKDYISIKVDREERPDVDNVYMGLAQRINAGGGWPLNLFLTPDRVPFTGGTYFPPEDKYGKKGFKTVLASIAEHWKNKPEGITEYTQKIKDVLASPTEKEVGGVPDLAEVLKLGAQQKLQSYESTYGGFSNAPKFPMGHGLSFLLRDFIHHKDSSVLEKVTFTLDNMASAGIYDQIGGGFHRYSTDIQWLVPHFEKMLYDQALLIKVYLEAYQVTGNQKYLRIVRETIEYLRRDMLDKEGGFYSAEDADSEGEEGTFYVWTPEEMEKHLGIKNASIVMDWYGVIPGGNFEGKSILTSHLSLNQVATKHKLSPEKLKDILTSSKQKLLEVRSQRVRPHLDDKIMVDWNGLLISALSMASRILPEGDGHLVTPALCRKLAVENAEFILKKLVNKKGRLIKSYRKGATKHLGFIEDYAFFSNGLLDLYEATFELKYLKEADRLARDMKKYFWDEKQGGFLFVAKDQEQLIENPKELYDGAIPSGNSVAALVFVRLAKLSNSKEFKEIPEKLVAFYAMELKRYPGGYPQFLQAVDMMVHGGQEFVLAMEKKDKEMPLFLKAIYSSFLPNKVVVHHSAASAKQGLHTLVPFVKNQGRLNGKPTFYLCENYMCKLPTNEVSVAEKLINTLTR